jgi:HSP20 family protein
MTDKKEMDSQRRIIPTACDIYLEKEQVVCKLEMPGVTREHLEIKVDGDRLIIHGIKAAREAKGEYLIREIRDGDYHHEFTLDDTVDRNKIDASVKNGAVTVTLGIKESEKPRKINVIAS